MRRYSDLEGEIEGHRTTIAGLERDRDDRTVEVATRKTEIGALDVQLEAARDRAAAAGIAQAHGQVSRRRFKREFV